MPVWHEKTKPFVAAGKLSVAGIVQEQHPRRAQLFMQWKQMDWPLLIDSFNLLDVGVVPITVFIDRHGIVRKVGAQPKDLDEFLANDFQNEPHVLTETRVFDADNLAGLQFGETNQLSRCIDLLTRKDTDQGRTDFRRGVALRMRFDSVDRQSGDFAAAVDAWQQALAENPNQYIWRRRIQQYGPRLDKPYPFYDWVAEAQADIRARGQQPVELFVPLSGAEIAAPATQNVEITANEEHPDPEGKVQRDDKHVAVEPTVVSATTDERPAVRVHLELRLDSATANDTKWNDEGGPVAFAADENSAINVGPISTHASGASRGLEFEISSADEQPLPKEMLGAVFYHVCLGPQQRCVFLRQDLTIPLHD